MANNKVIIDLVLDSSNAESNLAGLTDELGGTNSMFGKMLGMLKKAPDMYRKMKSSGNLTFKSIKTGLISTGLGAFVVLFGVLLEAFLSTQKGADGLARALAPIKGAFDSIRGIIQDLATNIFGQLSDRWTITSGVVMNGIDSIRLKWSQWIGDSKKSESILKDIEERTNSMNVSQKELNKSKKKFNDLTSGAGARVAEATKNQLKVVNLGIEIEKMDIKAVTRKAELNKLLTKQLLISKDASKTDKEKFDAIERAKTATIELGKIDSDILDKKIAKKELENSFNDTSREDEMDLALLVAERTKKEEIGIKNNLKFIGIKNTLIKKGEKERTDAEKQRVADQAQIEQDAEDTKLAEIEKGKIEEAKVEARKKLWEKINDIDKNQRLTEEELELEKVEREEEKLLLDIEKLEITEQEKADLRIAILENSENVMDSIKNKYRDKEIKKSKDDAKKKADIEKMVTRTKLELASQSFGQMSEIMGKESAAGKAAAIAKATIDTYLSATASYTALASIPVYGPALGTVAAGLAITSGLMNVSKIVGVKFADGGIVPGSSFAGDKISASLNSGEMVLNQVQQKNLFEQANISGGSGSGSLSEERVIELINIGISQIEVIIIESKMTDKQKEVEIQESEFSK